MRRKLLLSWLFGSGAPALWVIASEVASFTRLAKAGHIKLD